VVVLWHDLICLCDKILMMCDGMHDPVNVSVMCAFVNRLFYGLECEHMSILELLLLLHC
jgi:hypothetical protein